MNDFVIVIRSLRKWANRYSLIGQLIPFHYYFLFGGLTVLFINSIFLDNITPIYAIGHYSFFLGCWLTLISKNYKLLPYGLWLAVIYRFYPFNYISVYDITEALLYISLGIGALKLDAYIANHNGLLENEEETPGMIKCPGCGKFLNSSDKFCTGCGYKL